MSESHLPNFCKDPSSFLSGENNTCKSTEAVQATSALVAFDPLLCSTIQLAASGQIGARKNSQAVFQTEVGSGCDSVFHL